MTRRAFASLAICVVILVSAAWAQDPNRPDQNQPQMGAQQSGAQQQAGQQGQQQAGGNAALMPPSAWVKAKEITDKTVKDTNNNDLGKINDLIMLPGNGFIPFAIISGSKVDRGGEDIAVPWSVLRFETGTASGGSAGGNTGKEIMLSVPKDTLQNAKLAGFKTNQWPDFALPAFVERVYREFDQTPPSYMAQAHLAAQVEAGGEGAQAEVAAPGEQGPGSHWFKISTLRDEDVKDSSGNKLGSVENVLIDLNNGHILFLTLSGREVGKHNEYVAVPWGALRIAGSGRHTHLVLDMTKDELKNAPTFKEDNWANVTNPTFLQNVFAFYHQTPYWEGGKTQQAGYTEPTERHQESGGGQQP